MSKCLHAVPSVEFFRTKARVLSPIPPSPWRSGSPLSAPSQGPRLLLAFIYNSKNCDVFFKMFIKCKCVFEYMTRIYDIYRNDVNYYKNLQ